MKFRKGIQFFAPPPAVIDSNITGYVNNNSGEGINLAFSSGDSSGTISLSADGKVITFSTPNDSYQLNNNIQNNATYVNGVLTLNTPIIGIYENANFTNILLSRGETKSYPLTFNSYVKWETISKTTLDLSMLSDIAVGTHTVKVKAKADGYIDSEFSNEVSYTKAPAGRNITFDFPADYDKPKSGYTYIKYGSAPSSESDFDVRGEGGGGTARDGSEVSNGKTLNISYNKGFVWGYRYNINDETPINLNYSLYTSAVEVSLKNVSSLSLYASF